jgi:Holliday junction resolvase RusA-like endonuclease
VTTGPTIDELTFTAVGEPAPAGSKRAFVVNGRARMVESSKKVRPWWQAVAGAAQEAIGEDWEPLLGPVLVEIVFFIKRPGYHYGTGRNAGVLRANAPMFVDKKPDVDKLERTVLDALKGAGVYRDDAQVARLTADKRYSDDWTGARITIASFTQATVSVSGDPHVGAVEAGTVHGQGVLL